MDNGPWVWVGASRMASVPWRASASNSMSRNVGKFGCQSGHLDHPAIHAPAGRSDHPLKRLFSALALVPALSIAQGLQLEAQLPAWVGKPWAAAYAARHLEIFGGIDPFFQRGDFNGDGKVDVAILVRRKPAAKIGILILHRDGQSALLGAGRAFGNGGDDFAWMDQWSVEERGSTQRNQGDPSLRPRADALVVAREGSASALISYRNGKYTWQQRGD